MENLLGGGAFMRVQSIICGILLAISVFLLSLTVSLHWVTYDLDFYKSQYQRLDVPENLAVDLPILMAYTEALTEYLRGVRASPNVEAEVRGRRGPLYGAREVHHLQDVRQLFALSYLVRNVSLFVALMLGGALFLKRDMVRGLRAYSYTVLSVGIALFVLGVLATLDFDFYFTLFHLVSFSNDLWLLDPATENLINMFPEPFFAAAAARIAMALLTSFSLSGMAALWASKKLSRS